MGRCCCCYSSRTILSVVALLSNTIQYIHAFSALPNIHTFSVVRTVRSHFVASSPTSSNVLAFSDRPRVSSLSLSKKNNNDDDDDDDNDMNPLTKASWFAVEAFGKAFGQKKETTNKFSLNAPPSALNEAIRRIELDNERSYFLSGEVDVEAYDPDCVFSDPFVAFSGRQRFVDNLANLGSFITEYDARMLNFEVDDAIPLVKTKVMVKLELNLPWKPILAWPWGVTYTIDPISYLITEHKEEWDIAPLEGVKQIFRKPKTAIKKKQ